MALSGTLVIVLTLVLGVCAEQVNYAAYPEDVREETSSTNLESPDATWQATDGQIPYQLSIRAVAKNGGVTTCGGSIIHKEWGLTAAHCTALRTTLIIKAGAANLSSAEVIIETNTWYNHPRFIEVLQRVVQPNDISLIKFGVVLEFSDNLQPIQLQRSFEKNMNYEDVRMITSGWGHTWTGIVSRTLNITQSGMFCTNSQDNTTRTCTKERVYTNTAIAVQLQSKTPEYLNWAYMRGLSSESCLEAYNYAVHIQESTLCAVFDEETTQSICLGDSGGPLTAEDGDGNPVLVGVTSFVSGLGCHTVFAPFGFTRPGHYHEWFTNVTGIDFDKELWINNENPDETEEESNENVTKESSNESTEDSSELSTNEDSSSEESESSSENTTESNTDSSTSDPVDEPSSEETTETVPMTEESLTSTTEGPTTEDEPSSEETTQTIPITEESSTSTTEGPTTIEPTPPIEETTETTLITEESYPEGTTTEHTTEFITESSTFPTEGTIGTTLVTEESYPEVTTTEQTTEFSSESSTFPTEQTTGTTLITEESYPEGTTTEFITESSTSPTDGTTGTTLITEESYPEVTATEQTTEFSSESSTFPTEGTTGTTLITEESYPEVTTTEQTTEFSSESSTLPTEGTTGTTLVTEETNTSTTEDPISTELTSESSTPEPTVETTGTTFPTEESNPTTPEEATTTNLPSSSIISPTREPTNETTTESNTQHNEEMTTSLVEEETNSTTTEDPTTTEESNTSTFEEPTTTEYPSSTHGLSTPEATSETIPEISFTKPNFEVTSAERQILSPKLNHHKH